MKLNKKVSPEVVAAVTQIDDYSKLADTIAQHLAVKIADKQAVLENAETRSVSRRCLQLMEAKSPVLQVEKRIPHARQAPDGEDQREYYLNEQMKAIQKELGDGTESDEARRTRRAHQEDQALEGSATKAQAELKKLRQMSPMSAEATVVRNYLDWLLSIPWGKKSKVKKRTSLPRRDLDGLITTASTRSRSASSSISPCRARQQADRADPVPRRSARRRQDLARQVDRQGDGSRVRPHVARRRARRGRDPRPPAHLHRLDARQDHPVDAQGQDPIRSSCSTRSTRWAWISAAIRRRRCSRCSTRAELDVQRSLSRGRLRSLERDVRDDGQHAEHPRPLMDRMEIIRIAGYTETRRSRSPSAICSQRRGKHGLKAEGISVADDARCANWFAVTTREAACGNLEREISKPRPQGGEGNPSVEEEEVASSSPKMVADYLGPQKYRYGEAERRTRSASSPGLAWTEVGGELLTIEGVMMPGKGR